MAHDQIKEMKKTIVFIIQDNGETRTLGTGFFIGIQDKENPKKLSTYLVSAKHVLFNKETQKPHTKVILRLNKRDGTLGEFLVDLSLIKIYEHSDQTVDVALFACNVDPLMIDGLCIPYEIIATKEIISRYDICEGDDIFFPGLFLSHIGEQQNYPLLRFGKIAMMSKEKIAWKEHKKPLEMLDLYLLECNSIGGHSGAPIFFQLNGNRERNKIRIGGEQIFLGGIMRCNFSDPSSPTRENSGIAGVTPAFLLHEILEQNSLL